MSRDYPEKEREFIESLKADTGRDLGEWMNAIGAQNLAHRNDIIDWFRQQGFLFSWASWLERIHHNGGKPIYYDEAAPKPPVPSAPEIRKETPPEAAPPAVKLRIVKTPPPPQSAPQAAPTSPTASIPGSSGLTTEVKAVIASAKAYAPLAGFLIRRVSEAIPDTRFEAGRLHVAMHTGPDPFALLAIGPKDLKLAFAGPPGVHEAPCEKARLANLGAAMPAGLTHMIRLTDARQIDQAFVDRLLEARSRVYR